MFRETGQRRFIVDTQAYLKGLSMLKIRGKSEARICARCEDIYRRFIDCWGVACRECAIQGACDVCPKCLTEEELFIRKILDLL